MALPSFRRVRLKDKETETLQANLIQTLQPILKSDIIDGTILRDVSLVSGSNTIDHNLNRPVEGWIIIDQVGNAATVYRTSWDTRTITLTASADTTISLWVF